MVSFSCEACGDIVTKKKLDQHRNQCRGASFSCIDCGVHFHGTEYRDHTSCISEAQKVQGSMYKEKEKDSNKKTKHEKRKSVNWDTGMKDMRPRSAYVEDVPEGGDDSQAMAVAVVDVPPKAPSPPPAASATSPLAAAESTENVNVFDFLVTDDTQKEDAAPYNTVERAPSEPLVDTRMVEHPVYYGNGDYSQYSQQFPQYSNGHPHQYMQYGFSYGTSPVPPSYARYDSWQNLGESQASQGGMAPPYVTPAPKEHRREKRDREKDKDRRVSISDNSEKKRKRHQVEELDLSSAKRPSSRDQPMTDAPRDDRVLHSGLTGGLSKLVTDPEFYEDRIDSGPTPLISPIKRSRRDRSGGDDEERKKEKVDRRKSSYASYSLAKVEKRDDNNRSNGRKIYIHDDKYGRSRSPDRERRYHDDMHVSHRRSRSADRKYHDDRHRDRPHRNGTTNGRERHVRESISSEDKPSRKHLRVIEYAADRDRPGRAPERPASVQPHVSNQVVSYKTRADLFLSYVQKGPDSERGCSINKVLKRYHRERETRGEGKEEDNKELWKMLRLRKNERGEVVLFI